jgi:hypothetical protein
MSNFDSIDIEGKGFIVSTETSSGYSGSDQKDLEYLSFWRKRTEPTMNKVFKAIEKELAAMANGPDAPKLIMGPLTDTTKKLERVWEEKIDGMDVPSHMQKGNGQCIYRMRLWPKGPANKVDVLLFVETLPSAEVRDGWKGRLLAAIEQDVKYDDNVPQL